jgi:multicomponent Na+:H+ antiporter subunit E
MLTAPADAKNVTIGIFVAIFVTFMTVDTFKAAGGSAQEDYKLPSLPALAKKIFWFICYVMVFLWECIKANLDVAWRVLHPTLPIRPGTIRVKTDLKSDVGLTFLANSITLTPGTTTVDIDKEGGYIYIHVLFLKDGYPSADMRLGVVTKFERILKRIFE